MQPPRTAALRSVPALPMMHLHPLWDNLDLVVESAICDALARRNPSPHAAPPPPSNFFGDQLSAFRVWLNLSASSCNGRPPAQLPILLQVDDAPDPPAPAGVSLRHRE